MVDASSPAGTPGAGWRHGYNCPVANPHQARDAQPSRWRSPRGRVLLLVVGLAGAGIAAAFLGGGRLGGGGAEPPPRVSGAPADVATTIADFQSALARRDYATICGTLFTREARAAAGGDRCPAVLQDSAADLRRPDVRILSIALRGDQATVLVRARVAGGKPVTDTIRLAREGGRYRIASAGTR
jgi:hypothetical protein